MTITNNQCDLFEFSTVDKVSANRVSHHNILIVFQKYFDPVILHVANGVAMCGWVTLLYFFTDSYTIITVSMGVCNSHFTLTNI